MTKGTLAFAIFLALALSAHAQEILRNPLLLASSTPKLITSSGNLVAPAFHNALLTSGRAAEPAPAPQGVYGIYPNLYWQTYVGYTYFRFYQVPGTVVNTNGIQLSMAYYVKDWVGVEGEITGSVGPQGSAQGKFAFGGGGLRLRWSAPRAVEVWVHAVGGGAHYVPRAFNSEGGLAYEGGGGIDLKAHHERIAYRVEVDMIGTAFYNTYQVSPKISTGIVYKF